MPEPGPDLAGSAPRRPERAQSLDNPVWSALTHAHAHLALGSGRARRYPSKVAPFAALASANPAAEAPTLEDPAEWRDLADLLAPGETIYVVAAAPPPPTILALDDSLPGLQMIAPVYSAHPGPSIERIRSLGANDRADMLDLIAVAFPGFFRPRTPEMGPYFGIRTSDYPTSELIAMAGERLNVPGYHEISGLCTRPGHTGRGYAQQLIAHLCRVHHNLGVRSYLHVAGGNTRAISLYQSLGFTIRAQVNFLRVQRTN